MIGGHHPRKHDQNLDSRLRLRAALMTRASRARTAARAASGAGCWLDAERRECTIGHSAHGLAPPSLESPPPYGGLSTRKLCPNICRRFKCLLPQTGYSPVGHRNVAESPCRYRFIDLTFGVALPPCLPRRGDPVTFTRQPIPSVFGDPAFPLRAFSPVCIPGNDLNEAFIKTDNRSSHEQHVRLQRLAALHRRNDQTAKMRQPLRGLRNPG